MRAIMGIGAVLILCGCGGDDAASDCGAEVECFRQDVPWARCCLGGPMPAACIDGRRVCPAGALPRSECTSFDPAGCEVNDSGSPPVDSGSFDSGGPPPDAPPSDAPLSDGGSADWAMCSRTSECILANASCCGVCGRPELEDVNGVNGSRSAEHYLDVCPESAGGPVPCPDCLTAPNPNLVVTCAAMQCEAVDVRNESDVSGCTGDGDCRLRVRECCECGGVTDPYALIAIRTGGELAYTSLVCDPGTACDDCLPSYPREATAFCSSGRCEVRIGD